LTFNRSGRLLREVSRDHAEHYDRLMDGGLYKTLVNNRMMVAHVERGLKFAVTEEAYRVINPKTVLLETYPYEWGFSQFRAAALHVLRVSQTALDHDMVLTGVAPGNVQFENGSPIWTDTLAFVSYREGGWQAYQQFVQQYLAPLALMAKVDVSLGQLLRIYPDGIPLEIASATLPGRTRINFGLMSHIHLNNRTGRNAGRATKADLLAQLDNLYETVESLTWTAQSVLWERSQADVMQNEGTFDQRHRFLRDALNETKAKTVWDMNAGAGVYSRIAAGEFGAAVVAMNDTPQMTELLWQDLSEDERQLILPLLIDWANPSPGLGWANRERRSIAARASADLLVCMGLVHRLALNSGVTLPAMAAAFARLAPALLVEFVPVNDPAVIAMLESGQHTIPDYTAENFEVAFGEHYDVILAEDVLKTNRKIYLLRRREA
ncbi:MAG: hypothetical protein AAGK74_04350, partial [Chloroflexota bacterium]